MHIQDCDDRVVQLANRYIEKLGLPTGELAITTNRSLFAQWLGRAVPFRIGGAYSMHPVTKVHRIFVHLDRLDLTKPHAIEVVVAEELIHMRDHLDGDFRRHSHHGFDRIAREVERMTGYTPAQQRDIFRQRTRRLFQHMYQCPRCKVLVPRRRRGTWSCGRCAPAFRRRLRLRELDLDVVPLEVRQYLNELNSRLLAEQ